MEHPLIGDIGNKTIEELGATINELYKKLGIAQRSGNGHLCNQLRMALETYNNIYQEKLRDSYKQNTDGPNFDGIINIE